MRAAWLLLLACAGAAAADKLPGYAADAGQFTVSGVSSGGYMAVQMQVAHSRRVKGAAALAAGPYYCAQGSLWTAINNCMKPGTWTPLPAPGALQLHAEHLATANLIDPLAGLAGSRVWLFSGTRDETVVPAVVDALRAFYLSYKADVLLVNDRPAGHAMVTEATGNACGSTERPFINNCNYDAAGFLLRHLFGSLVLPASRLAGRLGSFDQQEFGMVGDGYVYVPAACEKERCRVHVAFHGCRQGAGAVGERFVREAGYNRWADTNRLIVLYPQVGASWWPYNPRGCWDWWGYTGAQYATKDAPQIRAVLAMVDRLGQGRK